MKLLRFGICLAAILALSSLVWGQAGTIVTEQADVPHTVLVRLGTFPTVHAKQVGGRTFLVYEKASPVDVPWLVTGPRVTIRNQDLVDGRALSVRPYHEEDSPSPADRK
jgi:hypothetical protein